ncbi:TAXI family TRAP transporter solute-binding subunit [Natrialba sp. INN-245]|uniref:TAXI family TRAP transporter solute-binding subunit n=1 Tax=Natrialba sp. INN-245 TaxID=2690967 RepID=UPI001311EFEF|nr:TAXI family TRAP transporter solute-binding subunit [Natrialba sp. INN-245]MWV38441.1 TAXI family TRAP transporter solute-binding subunit [Natrialba sp. INN-245]
MVLANRRQFLTSGLAVGTGLVAGCLGGDDDARDLSIHTAGEGASHYTKSAPLVELLPEHTEDPPLSATVSTSDGSVANIRNLDNGEIDIGTTVDQIGHLAYNGEVPFEDEIDIRCIMRSEVVAQYYVVRDDSEIETIFDLDGVTMTSGPEGSGTHGQHDTLMDHYGLETDDQYMGYGEGLRALRDGDLDAFFGHHGSDTMNAFATDGDELRVLGWTEDEFDSMQEVFPWTARAEVTPDMLENYEETELAMGTNSFWVTMPEMDDDVVYEMTRAILENPEPIQESNVNSENLETEWAYYDFGVPYHDGSLEYFEEHGLI